MNEIQANRLSDFPPDEFGIRVFCTHCDHQAWLNRAALPETLLGLVDRTHRRSLTETQRRRATQCPCFRGLGPLHTGQPLCGPSDPSIPSAGAKACWA